MNGAASATLLVTFPWRNDDAPAELTAALEHAGAGAMAADVFRPVALDGGPADGAMRGCAYLAAAADGPAAADPGFSRLGAALGERLPLASVRRLVPLAALRGASHGRAAPYHYIVETSVAPEDDTEFNAWYEGEHLPGLAAVPGTVRAARYVDGEAARRYYACYDLELASTLGSPPWLAVRGTPWSARVRPTFRDTTRTMYRRITGRR